MFHLQENHRAGPALCPPRSRSSKTHPTLPKPKLKTEVCGNCLKNQIRVQNSMVGVSSGPRRPPAIPGPSPWLRAPLQEPQPEVPPVGKPGCSPGRVTQPSQRDAICPPQDAACPQGWPRPRGAETQLCASVGLKCHRLFPCRNSPAEWTSQWGGGAVGGEEGRRLTKGNGACLSCVSSLLIV